MYIRERERERERERYQRTLITLFRTIKKLSTKCFFFFLRGYTESNTGKGNVLKVIAKVNICDQF